MGVDGVVSRLSAQVLSTTERRAALQANGEDTAAIDSIVRSLRLTLGCVLASQDPREAGATGFTCVMSALGEPVVRHQGQILPVDGPYLKSLFAEAGVEFAPGEVILLDAALAQMLCEEALSRNGFEEGQIREEKARLVAAYLAADALLHGPSEAVMPPSTEAA